MEQMWPYDKISISDVSVTKNPSFIKKDINDSTNKKTNNKSYLN